MSAGIHRVVSGPAAAPAVVFANSLGSDLTIWDPQAAALEGRFSVVRYDLPGHGRSPARPGQYTIRELADDLVRLCDEMGVDQAAIVGISIGGMIAMRAAIDHPRLVTRLVAANTSPRLGAPGAWAQRAEQVSAGGMAAVADAVAARWLTPEYAAEHPDRLAWTRAMILATDPVGYAGCCWAIERMDLTGELARIAAPTLVISGERDPAIPSEDVERIATSVPNATHEEIPDAAHLPNLQHPERFTALIAAHLAPLLEEPAR